MNDAQRIETLRTELHQHNHDYYILARPTITDVQYDRLFAELRALEAQHPELANPNSPTARVGCSVPNQFTKVKHDVPMMSLENTFEVADAVHRIVSEAGPCEVILEPKIDGLACSLKYVAGKLTQAVTRGDHEIGDDITTNARTVKNIPLTISYKGNLEVRGEVYIAKTDFVNLNASLDEAERFANARNAAAGSLKQKDSSICAKRGLKFIAYHVVGPRQHLQVNTQLELLAVLKAYGFPIAYPDMASFHIIHFNGNAGDVANLESHLTTINTRRKGLPYDTDGCVIKVNSLEKQAELGNKTRAPRWAAAFKFEAEKAVTTIENIEWQVGRTGKVTPVAILNPVNCGGVTVQRATLNNPDYIAKLNIDLYSKVEIERGGEVIPTVLRVLEKPGKYALPISCPCCKAELVKSGANLFCTNSDHCEDQIVQKLQHAVGKSCLDWHGMGIETVRWFVKEAKVTALSHLFGFSDSWVDTHVTGAAGKVFLTERAKAKNAPLWRKLAALGIDGVGQTHSKELSRKYHSLEEIVGAGQKKLESILGPVATQNFVEFVRNNVGELDQLDTYGYSFSEEAPSTTNLPLAGKTFCITGGLMSGTRPQVQATIEKYGGIMKSVSKKLDYLIVGTGGGAKENNAKEKGIACISEEELYTMIGIGMPVAAASTTDQWD
jgi:DNA ligase (NAD+)